MESDFKKNPTERAVVAAIYFELFNKNFEEAQNIASSSRFDSPIMLVAKGWFDAISRDDDSVEVAKKYFEEALKTDQRNIEAYFGICKVGERAKNYQFCQAAINDILEMNPDFVPGLIEKCKMGVFKRDFAYIKEGYQELLRIEKNNI